MRVAGQTVEVTRHEVYLPGLPRRLHGLRLVQLTDLHVSRWVDAPEVRGAVHAAHAFRPDLVVVTGDFAYAGTEWRLPHALAPLRSLRAPLGLWGVLGNHDHWDDLTRIRREVAAATIRLLDNGATVPVPGLILAGIDDLLCGQPDLNAVREAVARLGEGGVLLLSHNPAVLPQVTDRPWLVLSGHTHGTQIAWPGRDPAETPRIPLVSQALFLKEYLGTRQRDGNLEAVSTLRYPAGWYADGQARLYVCRGLGLSGLLPGALPFRPFCPPEIACFVLRSG